LASGRAGWGRDGGVAAVAHREGCCRFSQDLPRVGPVAPALFEFVGVCPTSHALGGLLDLVQGDVLLRACTPGSAGNACGSA